MRIRIYHGLVLCLLLAGCTDFAGVRLDGVPSRRQGIPDAAQRPPQPVPTLIIPEPPIARAAQPTVVQAKQEVPQTPEVAAPSGSPLRLLHQKAAERYRTMDSYVYRMKRREVVAGKNRPEEIVLVKFRQEPWSVYFKWLGNEGKGREVVHVKGRYDNQIHTLTAAGDVPLLPGGQRFSVSPDSPLIKAKSRHPITEAGLGSLIDRFGKLIAAAEQGDPRQSTLKYLGRVKRPEFEGELDAVLQTVPPQCESLLPVGGRRWWFFDPASSLPVLLVTHDDTSREVEYYCHDHIQFPVRLDDDDFNPDRLWKK
jgi:Protein of unknown function (DUF1571)